MSFVSSSAFTAILSLQGAKKRAWENTGEWAGRQKEEKRLVRKKRALQERGALRPTYLRQQPR